MQDIYYIDNNFDKENSFQYTLSIRYSTDGFSFCIHDSYNRLLVFAHYPSQPEHLDNITEQARNFIETDSLLSLKYRKVYIITCNKDKLLIPACLFDSNTLSELYQTTLRLNNTDTIIYRKIQIAESYLAEALPCDLIEFLTQHYQGLCIVNEAYPFIIQSLSGILFNTFHLFIHVYQHHFDILITESNHILLFNTFQYQSVNDILYYALNCLQQCHVDTDNLQTVLSGYIANQPNTIKSFSSYLPNISIINFTPLSQVVKNNDLNSSIFIHLLNIHKCE